MGDKMTRKRKCLIILAAICLTLTACTAGNKITLDDSKDMQPQIDEFKEWYSKLSASERAEWDTAFDKQKKPQPTTRIEYVRSAVPTPAERMVWIPRTGSKYHSKSTCSNMKNPRQVTISEAIRLGYEPCSKCNK